MRSRDVGVHGNLLLDGIGTSRRRLHDQRNLIGSVGGILMLRILLSGCVTIPETPAPGGNRTTADSGLIRELNRSATAVVGETEVGHRNTGSGRDVNGIGVGTLSVINRQHILPDTNSVKVLARDVSRIPRIGVDTTATGRASTEVGCGTTGNGLVWSSIRFHTANGEAIRVNLCPDVRAVIVSHGCRKAIRPADVGLRRCPTEKGGITLTTGHGKRSARNTEIPGDGRGIGCISIDGGDVETERLIRTQIS